MWERIVSLLLLAVAVLILATVASFARWKPEYAQNTPEVRSWYESRELTPAAQLRFPFKSCCAHSDVVKTKFKVSNDGAKDEWWWLDGVEWKRIPDDVIHWGEKSPDGQAVMFALSGNPTCFFPPDGGI